MQSVFFSPSFASSVFHDALHSEDSLLDNPHEVSRRSLEFFQTLYNTDNVLSVQLASLITSLNQHGYESTRVDEHLVSLLHYLIHTHKKEAQRARKVGAVRPSTKKEIYKRLCVAKDLLHSSFMNKLELDDISRTACLSSPQLVRQFRTVFHTTPHQYLTRIRLDHAAGLLKHSSTPVQEISWRCGFQNTSAFCRLFKTTYGISPLSFRTSK
jgi:AraC-like DNA-binding protein